MSEPRPDEFRRFHDLLVEHAPDGYTPWYFRVRKGSKAPATKYGSWKSESARLDVDEAAAWMEDGGNVGIAGTADDALVNVDIDDEDETTPDDLKETLIARSRSRTGVHAWYFTAPGEEIPNIPTDDAGEVRANWQYVVAPGSYVDTDPDDVPDEHRDEAGYYTVEREAPVTSLRFDELPAVFREHQEAKEQDETDAELQYDLPDDDDRRSALFQIDAEDVVRKEGGSTDTDDRWSSLFHGSDTDANMSVSSQGLIQCWRHGVTHNGFQALVVLSDYPDGCKQVGTAHKRSSAGPSSITTEDGAHVWEAWKYAKENNYIPDDDPVPYSAIRHICRDEDLCPVSEIPDTPDDGSLPADAYDAALKMIEGYYGITSGRAQTDEFDDSSVPDKPNVERVVDDETSSESSPKAVAEQSILNTSELDIYEGGYGYIHTDDDSGEQWFERVTNFTLDVESFLFKDGERLIDMSVNPLTGEEPYDVTVPASVFNDTRRFRDNVVLGLTTTYEGSPRDLNELRKLVGGQSAPIRQGTHHMGLHIDSGEFVTPEGVLTADGWSDDPTMSYMEREIAAERAFELAPDTHDDYDADDVSEILELLPQTRNSERFLPVLGWLYTAPLRPLVQEWEGQFNTLHVTGETGAGKSSTLSIAWQLLGMDGDPMACDDTKFALTTAMASTNSVPMWFDEYKPGDMKDWELDRFQTLMRKSTRGGVETRGNADKSTEEYRLQAPLMISGEQAVQGAAEERRSIQTRFLDDVKDPGSATREAFGRLTGTAYTVDGETVEPAGYDLQQHALAYYEFILEQDQDRLYEQWRQSREYVRDLLTAHGIAGVDDLPRQGIQTIHFGLSLFARFGTELGATELPTPDEIDRALLYIARQFGDKGSRKSHLDRFVELTARAAAEEYIEDGEHYTVVNEGTPEEEIALKLNRTFDAVSKYARDYALDGEDMLNTAKDYRERIKEAAEKSRSYINHHSKNTRPLNRCVRLDAATAVETLDIDVESFGATPQTDEDAENGAEEAEEADSNPTLQAGEVDLSGNVTDKSEVVPVRGTVAAVWRGRYTLEAELMSDAGSVDMEIRGFDDPGEVPLSPGVTYEIRGLRARNPSGEEPYVEFRPTSTPKTLERPEDEDAVDEPGSDEEDAVDESATSTAATDGSGEEDVEQSTAKILQVIRDAGEPLSMAEIVKRVSIKRPDEAKNALERAVQKGRVIELNEDSYEVAT